MAIFAPATASLETPDAAPAAPASSSSSIAESVLKPIENASAGCLGGENWSVCCCTVM